jgi:hypothetical protein
MPRRSEFDVLRGLMLVLMTVTHLPTRFSDMLGQPFGFVSAAEGFVFLSAFLVGAIYTGRAVADGVPVMRRALWSRAFVIYACHAAMLLFLFTVIAAIGIKTDRRAIINLISFYLQEPLTALWTGFALIYNPPLLDILPMYVLFMLVTPLLLVHALKRGWEWIFAASMTLWFLEQFGLGTDLYNVLVAVSGLKVPLHETGAFQIIAWQLLWVFGLWTGATSVKTPQACVSGPHFFPRWMVAAALAIGLGCMAWRHAVGQAPFAPGSPYNVLFDKWQLGPLRLVDFMALLVLTMRFGPALMRLAAPVTSFRFLEVLGAATLPLFCAHLVIALIALSVIGDRQGQTPLLTDSGLLGASFLLLYALALGEALRKRGRRKRQERLRAVSGAAGAA